MDHSQARKMAGKKYSYAMSHWHTLKSDMLLETSYHTFKFNSNPVPLFSFLVSYFHRNFKVMFLVR